MAMTISPLATAADFIEFGSNAELVQNTDVWNDQTINRLLVRATTHLQTRCQRRIVPFTGKVESHRAYGISPDEYGEQGDMPMDLTGALGWSQASALGVSSMVREFWLDETAPIYGEWWTFTLETVEIERTFGDVQTFSGPDFVQWQGPEVDTGHIRMPIGTYCPIGSTIRVTYGGGYNPIPDDLNLACIFQAMKFLLIGAEPEERIGMTTKDLDAEIVALIGEYAQY